MNGGRTTLLLAFLMAIGGGCSESTDRGPVHDSTMVEVLIELHLAVARAEATSQIPPNIRDSILIAYDLDSTTYADAVMYYAEHPQKYEEIYSRVLDRLSSERMPLGYADEDEGPSAAPPPPSPH